MRNVLIDSARSFRAAKRNGGRIESTNDIRVPSLAPNLDLVIAVRRAMDTLRRADQRHAAVLEMRFRDGFTLTETAEALRISPRTANRILKDARGRLQAALA